MKSRSTTYILLCVVESHVYRNLKVVGVNEKYVSTNYNFGAFNK